MNGVCCAARCVVVCGCMRGICVELISFLSVLSFFPRYYTAETNHGDGMAFAGDSVFGDDAKKPLTWFSSMIKQGWLPAR